MHSRNLLIILFCFCITITLQGCDSDIEGLLYPDKTITILSVKNIRTAKNPVSMSHQVIASPASLLTIQNWYDAKIVSQYKTGEWHTAGGQSKSWVTPGLTISVHVLDRGHDRVVQLITLAYDQSDEAASDQAISILHTLE